MKKKQCVCVRIIKLISNNKVLSLVLVALLIGIPVAIWHWFPIWWGMSEVATGNVLLYYGALLTACGTAFGVYLSIAKAQENYREDLRNKVRPYFALTHMHIKAKYQWSLDMLVQEKVLNASNSKTQEANGDSYYEEFRLKRVCVVITKEKVKYQQKFAEKQEEIIKQLGNIWQHTAAGGRTLTSKNYISFPCELDNIGVGAAVDFKLAFSRQGTVNAPAANFYTIKSDESVYFHLFSDDFVDLQDDEVLGKYDLELRYKDIFGNQYSQTYPFNFVRQNNGYIMVDMEYTMEQSELNMSEAK